MCGYIIMLNILSQNVSVTYITPPAGVQGYCRVLINNSHILHSENFAELLEIYPEFGEFINTICEYFEAVSVIGITHTYITLLRADNRIIVYEVKPQKLYEFRG